MDIIRIAAALIAMGCFVWLVLPDLFPWTNLDEGLATVLLLGIMDRYFGIKVIG